MGLLGKFEILEELGGGAMGNVYCARDTFLDRKVALKTIRTGSEVDPVVRQRFYTEARACARLTHPSIITVYDLGEVENTAYISMELLVGSDFKRIIQERRPLPVAAKVAAIAQVCQAIAHAHRHGVVHRDIKPSNLFLTDDGRAKVLDFGIARLPSSHLTLVGQILGTPNYMAPEQILDRPTDGRADLFSVAVVFFELLTYIHPFQGPSIPRRIVHGDPDSLFVHDTTLPPILEQVMARALAKDPDQRYQTGDQFAADLYAMMGAMPGAIPKDASPGFSPIELPSPSIPTVSVPEPTGDPIGAPEGVDSHEWRLSEALRLLPGFEAAIDSGDGPKARAALLDLKARLARDNRFSEAIRLCESRLAELVSSAPVLAGGGTSSLASESSSGAPAVPPVAGPSEVAPSTPVDLDVTSFYPPSVDADAFREPVEPPGPAGQRAFEDQPVEFSFGPQVNPSRRPPSSLIGRVIAKSAKAIVIVAGLVVCAVLLLVATDTIRQPAPLEAVAATASLVRNTVVYERPDAAGREIGSLAAGTLVNVVRVPDSANQQWVRVQRVTPKVLRPGYVHLNDLSDWQGRTADSALALARTFGAGDSATDAQIGAQIAALNEVVSRFSAGPATNQARLDIVQWRLILARRHQAAGAPLDDLRRELTSLREDLTGLVGEQDLQSRAVDLISQADALISATKPPPPPVLPPAVDLKPLLLRAQRFWEAGEYDEALSTLRTILQRDAANKQALNLKARIDRAVALEKQYEKK